MLTRRLQVLIDDERYHLLKRESERAGAPIGELVRRAIDREYAFDARARAEAGKRLLSMDPPPDPGPEPEWASQKREMLDARERKLYPAG